MRARVTQIPHEQCSWVVLAETKARRVSQQELLFEFERFLPRPIEYYAIDLVTGHDGRIIGCAARADVIRSLAATKDIIRPDRIPEVLGTGIEARSFQLARGEYRSSRTRYLNRSLVASLIILAICLAGIATTGLISKSDALNKNSAHIQQMIDETYARIIPVDHDYRQPRAIVVQSMLRQLERTSTINKNNNATCDVRQDVAALLSRWPDTPSLSFIRLEVGQTQAAMEVSLANDTSASSFFDAYAVVDGWASSSPTVRRSDKDQQLTLRLQRKSAETIR